MARLLPETKQSIDLSNLQKLNVKLGDTLLFQSGGFVPPDIKEGIKTILENRYPGVAVLFLERGLTVAIIGKADD